MMMGVLLGPLYGFVDETLVTFGESVPDAMLAIIGNADLATPEGWYQTETFSLMGPIAVILVTAVIGARALAGEEAQRTMGLLLANPIKRSTVVTEKSIAMLSAAFAVGFFTFAGVAVGSLLGGLLGGLWEPPGFVLPAGVSGASGASSAAGGRGRSGAVVRQLREQLGLDIAPPKALGEISHVFTHRLLRLHVFHCDQLQGRARYGDFDAYRWVSARQLGELPQSSLTRKAAGLLG
jgi:8-oxo-dGTP pyrophosphatase MutT (NUDIX family)